MPKQLTKLHLISDSFDIIHLNKQYSRYVEDGEQLLFIGESVINLLDKQIIDRLSELDNKYYALKADCKCRGISELLPAEVEQVTDIKMVELTLNNHKTISW